MQDHASLAAVHDQAIPGLDLRQDVRGPPRRRECRGCGRRWPRGWSGCPTRSRFPCTSMSPSMTTCDGQQLVGHHDQRPGQVGRGAMGGIGQVLVHPPDHIADIREPLLQVGVPDLGEGGRVLFQEPVQSGFGGRAAPGRSNRGSSGRRRGPARSRDGWRRSPLPWARHGRRPSPAAPAGRGRPGQPRPRTWLARPRHPGPPAAFRPGGRRSPQCSRPCRRPRREIPPSLAEYCSRSHRTAAAPAARGWGGPHHAALSPHRRAQFADSSIPGDFAGPGSGLARPVS